MINLKDVSIDTRTVEVDYPGLEGFKVSLNYMSRATSKRIIESARKDEMKNGMVMSVQDDDKFLDAFVDHAIAGWTGLTLDYVEKIMLIDIGDNDPSTVVEFSKDNAIMLMKNSAAFDSFVNATVFQLDTFRLPRKE